MGNRIFILLSKMVKDKKWSFVLRLFVYQEQWKGPLCTFLPPTTQTTLRRLLPLPSRHRHRNFTFFGHLAGDGPQSSHHPTANSNSHLYGERNWLVTSTPAIQSKKHFFYRSTLPPLKRLSKLSSPFPSTFSTPRNDHLSRPIGALDVCWSTAAVPIAARRRRWSRRRCLIRLSFSSPLLGPGTCCWKDVSFWRRGDDGCWCSSDDCHLCCFFFRHVVLMIVI